MADIYLECGMGAAGDMLGAALYELLNEEDRLAYIEEMNNAGLPGVTVLAKPSSKCGIMGTYMDVRIHGESEGHEHDHSDSNTHNHGGEHHHHSHTSLTDIHKIIMDTPFSSRVKEDACAVYDIIAEAESKAHGKEVSQVHFHEVGMLDAVADVMGVCRLVEMLSPQNIYASPVRTGFGEVRCQHGLVPVPAPATAHILRDVPIYAGDIAGEMCTPTGAALLTYFADDFIPMPIMKTHSIGYGMGYKDFPRANCVRAFWGEIFDKASNNQNNFPFSKESEKLILSNKNDCSSGQKTGKEQEEDILTNSVKETLGETESSSMDTIIELSCNIDDMTGEAMGFAMEELRAAGALEVYALSVMTKKGRPGNVITLLCTPEAEEKMVRLMFGYTTTWGVRRREVERYIMQRDISTVSTALGDVRVKTGKGFGVLRRKAEYEDIAKLARQNEKGIGDILSEIDL